MKIKSRVNSIYLDFTYHGIRHRPTFAGLDSSKKIHWKTAQDILIQIQADIANNKFKFKKYFPYYKNSNDSLSADDITIQTLLEKWFKQKQTLVAPSTYRKYKGYVYNKLIPAFGVNTLSNLKTSHIRDWIHSLPVSSKTISNTLTPLREIFKQAFLDELIDRNIMDHIINKSNPFKEKDPFNNEEKEKILNSALGQTKNFFQFAFWTGLRTSEIIALKWDSIDLKKATASIHEVRTSEGNKQSTKTRHSKRIIQLLPPAVEALNNQKNYTNTGHIFLNDKSNKPWKDDQQVRKIGWIPLIKASGVRYRKPYNTRHTYASTLLSMGANPMFVAKQMGHKDWSMIIKVYGDYIEDVDKSLESVLFSLKAQFGHKEFVND